VKTFDQRQQVQIDAIEFASSHLTQNVLDSDSNYSNTPSQETQAHVFVVLTTTKHVISNQVQTSVILVHLVIVLNKSQLPQIIMNYHDITQHLQDGHIREAASFQMSNGNNVCLLVTKQSNGLFV